MRAGAGDWADAREETEAEDPATIRMNANRQKPRVFMKANLFR
jgi:hypothetical protein